MADAFAGQTRAQISKAASEFLTMTEGLHERASSPPLNLLVVDDDEHIREVCRSVASETGMKVSDVGTAEEALELLETCRETNLGTGKSMSETGFQQTEQQDFGAVLRHELNNPLTGILGNAELLLVELRRKNLALPEPAQARLETIAALAVRMRETVRRLSQEWQTQSPPLRPPLQMP